MKGFCLRCVVLVNTFSIVFAIMTAHVAGQETVKAVEYYSGHSYRKQMNRDVEAKIDREQAVRDVRGQLKGFVNLGVVSFNGGDSLDIGEYKDSVYMYSEADIESNGSGYSTIHELKHTASSAVYSSDNTYPAVMNKPFNLEINKDKILSDALNNPKLTVPERRLVIGAPAVTLLRFQELLKREIEDDRQLPDVLESFLDHLFTHIWIKNASVLSDTTWINNNLKMRKVDINAVGFAEDVISRKYYNINVTVDYKNNKVVLVTCKVTNTEEVSQKQNNRFKIPNLFGEGRYSIIVERL